ncbi:heme biosynthesis protein HemY [Actinotalea sp. Marseille-Q4924]|uniref:heme biosynthesis protein HemY n=1 Tax=Actinotalea sp. Marseille-Q4924 TaxID=2866571 RepID=UPI001CE44463|nr:heme biosynthesis protein HemY [Actinotalea sp. Marseille-Q4924]
MNDDDADTSRDDPPGPFTVLPEPVRLEDTVAGQEVTPARDPEAGRDTETEFMLRYM